MFRCLSFRFKTTPICFRYTKEQNSSIFMPQIMQSTMYIFSLLACALSCISVTTLLLISPRYLSSVLLVLFRAILCPTKIKLPQTPTLLELITTDCYFNERIKILQRRSLLNVRNKTSQRLSSSACEQMYLLCPEVERCTRSEHWELYCAA